MLQLHVMFVCLFMVVLRFSLEFSCSSSCCYCCRCIYCEYDSII